MLAANEAVASHLEHAEIPSIYRIHEPPDPKRILDFEEVASHFGVSRVPSVCMSMPNASKISAM